MTARRCLLATLALIGAACSKSDAENFADEYCGAVAKCCDRMGSEGDGMLCKIAFTGGGFNAEAGRACLAEVRTQVAADTFCTVGAAGGSACQNVVESPSGNRKPGESCDFDNDCARSNEGDVVCASRFDGTDWIHRCQLQMRGLAGSPCLGTRDGDMFSTVGTNASELPARGYVCNTADGLTCASGTCAPLAAVEQSCSYSSACVRSAFCDNDNRCAARVAPGGTCTGADDAECTDDHYCATDSPRQCKAKVATGSPCSYDDMCTSNDCNGTTCEPGLGEQMGWAVLCM